MIVVVIIIIISIIICIMINYYRLTGGRMREEGEKEERAYTSANIIIYNISLTGNFTSYGLD